jgi:branched-chain amino acid transport system substrate-binding protein
MNKRNIGRGTRRVVVYSRLGVALATAGLLAAACSSGGSGSSSGGSNSSNSNSNSSNSNSPLILGQDTSLTGPGAPAGTQDQIGQDAFIDALNASGGVNGRKVKIIYTDNKTDTATSIANVHELVQQDHILMDFLTLGPPQCDAVGPYFQAVKVPLLLCSIPDTDSENWTWSAILSSQTEAELGVKYLIEHNHAKTIGMVMINGQQGQAAVAGAKQAIAETGGTAKLVTVQTFETTSTDLSAQAAAMKLKNPDAVFVGGLTAPNAYFYNAAQALGWKPKDGYFSSLSTFDPSFLALIKQPSYLNGTYFDSFVPPLTDTTVPGVQQYLADMKKYAPGKATSEFQLFAFGITMLATEILNRTGKDPTPATIFTTMETKMNGYDADGILPPISWSATNTAGAQSMNVAVLENGQFTLVTTNFK